MLAYKLTINFVPDIEGKQNKWVWFLSNFSGIVNILNFHDEVLESFEFERVNNLCEA